MNSSHSKLYLLVVLVLLAGLVYWLGTSNFKQNTPVLGEEGKFSGTLVRAENNLLVLDGVFTAPKTLAGDLKGSYKFSVKIDENTKIKSILISMPTGDKAVDIKDLPKQEISMSVSDLKKLGTTSPAILFVSFNFTNKDLSTAVASEITYQSFR